MTNCLYCEEPLVVSVSWEGLFSPTKRNVLCEACQQQLVKIQGNLCQKCGRSLATLSPEHYEGEMCTDCQMWQCSEWKGVLCQNRSLYHYNDFLKAWMAQFKFRGDYALIEAVKNDWCSLFQKTYSSKHLIVPIPLSDERLYERGFNQSNVLANMLSNDVYDGLYRTNHEKQSKKSRAERLQVRDFLAVKEREKVAGKEILLIDDIYTTGMTLHVAAKQLKQAGATSVQSFTLIRS
ncbi:ComF family protein [Bacillus sp. CGMCC 1.16541]|uniref:ComF family protein n=1 Tax=Bacillus sp. CGMCC 1.16541 TaxID=2185143 RepID=UPI000D73FB6B|nr:ComF family protein [Bacillus sp. CGMCC 1.16541]